MVVRGRWAWISLGLACWAIAASIAACYLWYTSEVYRGLYERALGQLETLTVAVDILIDYGNGTKVWFNGTRVSAGFTVFDATCLVADVDYIPYSGPEWVGYPNNTAYLVTAINGVCNNETHAWFWWFWDASAHAWVFAPYGANHVNATVVDGGIYAWTFRSFTTWPPPPP